MLGVVWIITAVGGTEFNEGAVAYWSAGNNSNGSSALSYIPEMAWNDTTASIAAGGGGARFEGLAATLRT